MKNFALHIPEGVKDYIGQEAALKEKIEQHIKKIFRTNSYYVVDTPTFEYLDVFTLGEESFQQPSLYHLVNRQGELMALRSDMTRSIARVVGTQKIEATLPQRFSYLANSFRYPERYQGKLHEFTQAGIELIGNKSLEADAEVIRVAINCLKEVGVNDFTVHIGSSQFLRYVLDDLLLDQQVKKEVYCAIEKKDAVKVKALLKGVKIEADLLEVLMEMLQCSGKISLLKNVKAKIRSREAQQVLEEMERLYELLEDYGVNECIIFDFSLMGYGQYYTGMMFQIFMLGAGSALVEGGRYDQLLEKFGKDLPAVGFGMSINLLLQCLIKQKGLAERQEKRLLVVCTPKTRKVCQEVSNHLRSRGEIVENSLCKSLEESKQYALQNSMAKLLYFKEGSQVEIYDLIKNTRIETTINKL